MAERDPPATRLCYSAVGDAVSLGLTSNSNGGEAVSGDVYSAQKSKFFNIQLFKRLVSCVKAISKTTDMFGKGRKKRLILIKGLSSRKVDEFSHIQKVCVCVRVWG